MAEQYAVISSYFYIPLGMIFVYRSGSQGLGSGSIPIISSAIELILRVLAVVILPSMIGYVGICLASPAAWAGAGFILPFFSYSLLKKIESGYRLG